MPKASTSTPRYTNTGITCAVSRNPRSIRSPRAERAVQMPSGIPTISAIAAVSASTPVQCKWRSTHSTVRTHASIRSAIGPNTFVKSQWSCRLAVVHAYIRRTAGWMSLSSHDGTSAHSSEPTSTTVVSRATTRPVRSRWFGRSAGTKAASVGAAAGATATDVTGSRLLAGYHAERVGPRDHAEPRTAGVDDGDRQIAAGQQRHDVTQLRPGRHVIGHRA